MKYSISILTTLALCATFVMSGCNSSSNNMEGGQSTEFESDRDIENDRSEVEQELRTFRAEAAERFQAFDRTTNELRREISNESDREVRDRLEIKLDGYEDTQRDLKREMENYSASGSDNWNVFKNSFNIRMNDLGNSLDTFFSTSSTTSPRNQLRLKNKISWEVYYT